MSPIAAMPWDAPGDGDEKKDGDERERTPMSEHLFIVGRGEPEPGTLPNPESGGTS